MNQYVKLLYDEHEIIVSAIEIAQHSNRLIDVNNACYEETVRRLIHFFRNYADKYHHFKEEEILFPAMAQKNEIIGGGIIQEMLANHDVFRALIKEIEYCLLQKEYAKSYELLSQYTNQLLDHIAAEDDELFVMTEQMFTSQELEKIMFQFEDCDRELGNEQKDTLKALLNELR